MEERRTCRRVAPVDDCIVVHAKTIGSLKDISRKGLHCSCFQESGCNGSDHQEIDILCGHGNFIVKGLRVKIVSMETTSGMFLKDFYIKKCRMQFENLRNEQASGIESILNGECLN